MVPASVLIVGIFKMVSVTGLNGTLWGVIIPGAATPTGVFMLRQYMLTIPDELLEAARMDAASEWSIYWRIVFPCTRITSNSSSCNLINYLEMERFNFTNDSSINYKNCIYYSIMSSRFSR